MGLSCNFSLKPIHGNNKSTIFLWPFSIAFPMFPGGWCAPWPCGENRRAGPGDDAGTALQSGPWFTVELPKLETVGTVVAVHS
jgi:hypothetical protein